MQLCRAGPQTNKQKYSFVSIVTHLKVSPEGLHVGNGIQSYSGPEYTALLWVLFFKSPGILWAIKYRGVNLKELAWTWWFYPCKFFHSCHHINGIMNFSLISFSKARVIWEHLQSFSPCLASWWSWGIWKSLPSLETEFRTKLCGGHSFNWLPGPDWWNADSL